MLVSFLFAGVLWLVLLMGSVQASSGAPLYTDQSSYLPNESVSLTYDGTVGPGGQVRVWVTDPDNTTLRDSNHTLTVGSDGTVLQQFILPPQTVPGTYTLWSEDEAGRRDQVGKGFQVLPFELELDRTSYLQGDTVSLKLQYFHRSATGLVTELLDPQGNILRINHNVSSLDSAGSYGVDGHTLALWHLDELSGGLTPDSGPFQFPTFAGSWGPAAQGPSVVQGRVKGALNFHGDSSPPYDVNASYLRVSAQPELQLTASFTLELWVYLEGDHPNPPLIGNHKPYDEANGWALGLGDAGDKPIFTAFNEHGNVDLLAPQPLSRHQWHHIAFTYDDLTHYYAMYIDGRLVRQDYRDLNITANDHDLAIGAVYNGTPGVGPFSSFDGLLDEIRISSVVRTPEELYLSRTFSDAFLLPRDALAGTWRVVARSLDGQFETYHEFQVRSRLKLEVQAFQPGMPLKVTARFDSPLVERFDFALIDPQGVTRNSSSLLGEPFDMVPAVEAEHLLGSWSFNESSGTVAVDGSGSNEHATLRFGPVFVPGLTGNGVHLDGVDDYIETQRPGPIGSAPRTVTLWARTASAGGQWFMTYGGSAAQAGSSFRVGVNSGCQGVSVDLSDGLLTYAAEVADDAWHHYAFVVPRDYELNLSRVRVYQDGQLLETVCVAHKPGQLIDTQDDNPLRIGAYYTGNPKFFNGTLDELRLYDTALEPWQFAPAQQASVELTLEPAMPGSWTLMVSTESGYSQTYLLEVLSPQKDRDDDLSELIFDPLSENSHVILLGLILLGVVGAAGFASRDERGLWWLHGGLLIPLFSRLSERELHEPDKFKAGQIFQSIKENPGINLAALSTVTGLKNGTLIYHLDRLERECQIVSEKVGRLRVFYQDDGNHQKKTSDPAQNRLRYLRKTCKRILAQMHEQGSITQGTLYRTLDLDQQLVSYHLRRLAEQGHVVRSGTRGFYTYQLSPTTRKQIEARGLDFQCEFYNK